MECPIIKNYVSDCCEAKLECSGEGETHYYICSSCKKECCWVQKEKDNEFDKLDF